MRWKEYKVKVSEEFLPKIENYLTNESIPYSIYKDDKSGKVLVNIYHQCENVECEKKVKTMFALLEFLIEKHNKIYDVNELDENSVINRWKKFFPPIRVGGFTIFSSREDWNSFQGEKKNAIYIPPSFAFGTGHHFTTSLCIRMIEMFCDNRKTFLDIGCGSGILSIAAFKRGFKVIDGFDIDEVCVAESKKNFLFNCGDDGANFFVMGIEKFNPKKSYDMICVNLYDDLILKYSDCIKRCCFENTVLIMSGIRVEKSSDIKSRFTDFILLNEEESDNKEWCGFVYKNSI